MTAANSGLRRQLLVGVALALLTAACGSLSPTAPTTATHTTTVTNAPTPSPTPTPTTGTPGAWSETFSGSLSNRWTLSNYVGINNTIFTPDNVDVSSGTLRLTLLQVRNDNGSSAIAHGAEVQSIDRYGFGTYTWVLRASSTSPTPDGPGDAGNGETSAAFVFFQNSTTEIDFEQEGGNPRLMHAVMFNNGRNVSLQDAIVGDSIWQTFHTYSFVWTPSSVVWTIDGQEVARQTQNVPQQPGVVIMNRWAVQHGVWGGSVQLGVPYYMFVRSFSFTPTQ